MAWSISMTQEGWANVHANLQRKSIQWLAEALAADADPDEYEVELIKFIRAGYMFGSEYLADEALKRIEENDLCDRGGHAVWVDKEGYHTVEVSLQDEDIDVEGGSDIIERAEEDKASARELVLRMEAMFPKLELRLPVGSFLKLGERAVLIQDHRDFDGPEFMFKCGYCIGASPVFMECAIGVPMVDDEFFYACEDEKALIERCTAYQADLVASRIEDFDCPGCGSHVDHIDEKFEVATGADGKLYCDADCAAISCDDEDDDE